MMRLVLGLALLSAGGAMAQTPAAQSASRSQDPATQFAMGEAFRLGTGVAIDRDQAIGWYRKAAAQGHTGAQDALGVMLFTKGERKQAIPLLQASAQRGDPRALYILGTAHFNGDYVPRDYSRAYAEMKRAAAGGLPEAQRSLAKMEPYLSEDDRSKAVALLAGRDVIVPTPSSARPLTPAIPSPPPPIVPHTGATLVPVLRPAAPIPAPARIDPPLPVDRPTPQPTIAASAPPVRPIAPAAVPSPAPVRPRPTPIASPPKPLAPGRWRVQLGAYRSAGQAENQWAIFSGKVAGIAKLHHVVAQAGDFWRLQADGIADRATADALCKRVTAAGGACFTLAP